MSRRKVVDSSTLKIEDQLNQFMVILVQAAIALRRERLAAAIRERRERRLERERAAAERARQIELRRRKVLEQAAIEWQTRRVQSAFIRALKRDIATAGDCEVALIEWLDWADHRVRRIDLACLSKLVRQHCLDDVGPPVPQGFMATTRSRRVCRVESSWANRDSCDATQEFRCLFTA
jgi:hypothetical protein